MKKSVNAPKYRHAGTLSTAAAAILFSLGGMLVKGVPWNPMAISGARSILAGLLLLCYMKLRGHRLVVNRTVLLGGLAMGATSTLYVVANKLTTSANAILLQDTAPIFIIFFMWAFFRVKPDALDLSAAAALFCGIVLFFYGSLTGGGGTVTGNFAGLLAGVTWALVFMMKQWKGSDNLSSVFFGCVFGTLLGMPWLFSESTVFTAGVLWRVLLIGFVQFGAAYIFLAEGLERTPPLTASLISMLEPVLNPILVALTVGERPEGLSLLGAAVVLITVLAYNILRSKIDSHQKERQTT